MKAFRLGSRAACVAAAGIMVSLFGSAAPSALGSLVYSGVWNLQLPATSAGWYLNVETGLCGEGVSGAPAGWDIQLWGSSETMFNVWGGFTGAEFMRQPGAGGGTNVANVAEGISVASGGSFGPDGVASFNSSPGHWNFNSFNIYGFRFKNAMGQMRYGWMRMKIGATADSRILWDYGYESSGGGIAAGVIPQPAALLMLAGGLVSPSRRRRTIAMQ